MIHLGRYSLIESCNGFMKTELSKALPYWGMREYLEISSSSMCKKARSRKVLQLEGVGTIII
jgi:hypothetical protein